MEKKHIDIMQLKNCKNCPPIKYILNKFRYGRGWKYHYPTETWIGDQDQGGKRYFNTTSWQTKTLQDSEINEEEYLTLNEFKLQSNPQ